MPDLNAGQPMKALDWPPAVMSQDSTQINNPTATAYTTGSPAVEVTFIGPTSGRVLIVVGGGLGNSAGADRIALSPEVRETNSSGTVVLLPTVPEHGYASENQSVGFHYGSRECLLDGLTPGQVYYAVLKYAVLADPGAQTGDIAVREIIVAPVP